jgi:hypothetical protein
MAANFAKLPSCCGGAVKSASDRDNPDSPQPISVAPGAGAFLTLPRGKPDHTAAERRSISAFQNFFGDQRNSGVAEHRQVISTGRPDTLFMWGCS